MVNDGRVLAQGEGDFAAARHSFIHSFRKVSALESAHCPHTSTPRRGKIERGSGGYPWILLAGAYGTPECKKAVLKQAQD
jgi:hypothetical protein